MKSQQSIGASVPRLSGPSRPSAIHGPAIRAALVASSAGIMAIVIFAILSVSGRWTWSEISKPCVKRFVPALTNLNAATAVLGIPGSSVLATPLAHRSPDFVFWHVPFAVGSDLDDAKIIGSHDMDLLEGSALVRADTMFTHRAGSVILAGKRAE